MLFGKIIELDSSTFKYFNAGNKETYKLMARADRKQYLDEMDDHSPQKKFQARCCKEE